MRLPATLKARVLTSIGGLVLIAFAATITVLTGQATSLQSDVSLQYAQQLAQTNASQTSAQLETALAAARIAAQSLRGLKLAGAAERTPC